VVDENRDRGASREGGGEAPGARVKPVRRSYTPIERPTGWWGRLDSAERVHLLKVLLWAPAGAFFGLVAGGVAGHPVLGALGGVAFVCGGAWLLVTKAGQAAGTIYNPSGRGTRKAEHSLAESLVARGLFEEAVEALRDAIREDPTDPGPYLRIARIHRDHLRRPAEALAWFKRARAEAEPGPGVERLVSREIVELLTGPLGRPLAAAPELARLAQLHPDTPEGRWAAGELAEVRKLIDTDES